MKSFKMGSKKEKEKAVLTSCRRELNTVGAAI
jgi:hypothetical protein